MILILAVVKFIFSSYVSLILLLKYWEEKNKSLQTYSPTRIPSPPLPILNRSDGFSPVHHPYQRLIYVATEYHMCSTSYLLIFLRYIWITDKMNRWRERERERKTDEERNLMETLLYTKHDSSKAPARFH